MPTTGGPDIAGVTTAVNRLLSEAVDRGQVPGEVCLVRWRGEVVFHVACGQAQTWPHQRGVELQTVFDLASPTNPWVTTAATLVLVDRGATAPDEAVTTYLPELRHGAPAVTFSHSSRMPAWHPLYLGGATREAALATSRTA